MISTDVLATAVEVGESTGQTTAATSALGREDFLQMLIAQLENQDPLNPQDATEFTAQLAQFSSLEQLLSIRNSIDRLADSEAVSQRLGAAGLIGREVTAEGAQVAVAAGGIPLAEPLFTLAESATATTVNVFDAAGRLVRTLPFGPLGQGEHEIGWD
ncbi:MAG: flagellar hook assembly protein FlgD, partial [Myxococcota bacterium]